VEGGGDAGPRLAFPVAFADDDIVVYRVGGDRPAASHRATMIVAHVIWLAALCAGAAGMLLTRLGARRRAHSEPVDG
jgi:hypothetical protein